MRRARTARASAVMTVAVTLCILASEFVFLTIVYHLDDRVDEQRLAHSEFSTALTAWSPGADPGLVLREAGQLEDSGAPGAATLVELASAWAADPTSTGADRLRQTDADVGAAVVAAQQRSDRTASLTHASLLLLVSIGWFFWFRSLVRRHRALQRTLTERQVVDSGERRLLALVKNSTDLVAVLESDSTVTFVSPAVEGMLGLAPAEVCGRRFTGLLPEGEVPHFVQALAAGEGEHSLRLTATHADGRRLTLEGTLNNLLGDSDVGGLVLTVRDVTERQRLEEQMAHQAFHDDLTGLANRQLFSDRLAHALRRRAVTADLLVVVVLDVDDFKNVNDSVGHHVGDQLLVEVAARLRSVVREGDTAARLGGDEFAVLMEGASCQAAHEVAERLLEVLAVPVEIDGEPHSVQASIGIAEALPGSASSEELLRNADVAMYWAKDRGKGTVAVYEVALHDEALSRLALRGDLQRAIREGELVLHYQPLVDLESGQVAGFEALVRWEHPELGLLPPGDFIPVAEQSGLIVPMGGWVLGEACRAAAAMQAGGAGPRMSVNVAAQQLNRKAFVAEVVDALAGSGLRPDRLVLEITESVLLDDVDTTVASLKELRKIGVRVAIDDFGTGYSSLSYLSELPVDVLKIDKSFVDRLAGSGQDDSLVEAIVAMGRSLRLATVAEGVELPEQAALLRTTGCALGQGYLWSRPVPLEAARALLTLQPFGLDAPAASTSLA